MTPADTPLPETRRELERLLGQCLLRLQIIESLLKAIFTMHSASGSFTKPEGDEDRRITETRQKTMGVLVGGLIGSVFVPEGKEDLPDVDDEAPDSGFVISQKIAFPAEEFARIEADLRELVALRNRLVHHFLDEHDIRTEDGCLVAQQALTTALDRISRTKDHLVGWAKEMDQTRKDMADELASPELYDWFVNGRIPWAITKIAQALLNAAKELALGDWVSVETATNWVAARHPDERPEGYGCRTWQQVIHESGLFDLQKRKINGRSHSWYRPRIGKLSRREVS